MPIVLARKPLSEATITDNVVKYGTGGLNIDDCRVCMSKEDFDINTKKQSKNNNNVSYFDFDLDIKGTATPPNDLGRFPANIILDETAAEELDKQSGNVKSTGSIRKKENKYEASSYKGKNEVGKVSNPYAGESGGASRYFKIIEKEEEQKIKLEKMEKNKKVKLMLGDNISSLKKLPDNSIDSIVSDPPYGLSFMGKKWDYDVPSIEFWKEVYRVLKPGGHILSFGGTRTYHRMVVNIEDAGFEIRDQIQWIYGSGFPKSLNVGKAYDKKNGNEREVVGEQILGGTAKTLKGGNFNGEKENTSNLTDKVDITKGTSQYEGIGTALKPANEPVCLARKPLSEPTITDNVVKYGTGGLNIDECRVGNDIIMTNMKNTKGGLYNLGNEDRTNEVENTFNEGRFPANIILDETAAEELDKQSGVSKSKKQNMKSAQSGNNEGRYNWNNGSINDFTSERGHNDEGGASRYFKVIEQEDEWEGFYEATPEQIENRFCYTAKVSKKERNMGLDGFEDKKMCQGGYEGDWSSDKEGDIGINKVKIVKNFHPTVKPVKLMAYLCKLITPKGGIILDPFMGSGSTGIAALLEGYRFVGMEMDEDYFKIAEARISNYEKYRQFLEKKSK